MSVELWTRVCGGYVVVALRGELDSVDAEMTGAAVAKPAEGGHQLIIDLEGLEYLDCHALSVLLHARETARQSGSDVLLAVPHGLVLRLLTLLLGVPDEWAWQKALEIPPGVLASCGIAAEPAGAGRWDD